MGEVVLRVRGGGRASVSRVSGGAAEEPNDLDSKGVLLVGVARSGRGGVVGRSVVGRVCVSAGVGSHTRGRDAGRLHPYSMSELRISAIRYMLCGPSTAEERRRRAGPGRGARPMITPPDTLPYRHVLTLPAMGAAVRMARETAEQVLTEWGVGPRVPCRDPALLILSELVANSVRHAAVLSPNVTVAFAGGPDVRVRRATAIRTGKPCSPPPGRLPGGVSPP